MRGGTRLALFMIIGGVALFGFIGCSDDNGTTTSPTPVTAVAVTPHTSTVEIGQTVPLNATVEGGDDMTVDWYVNDVLGGDAAIGTVTHNSPATYRAPDGVPDPAEVVVKAVSTENVDMMDSCTVSVQFTTLHVNASTGNDETGTGSLSNPVKSITRGLELAQPGMTVMVAPGVYDAANGELFPLKLPTGVALVGEDWEGCMIRSDFPTDQDLVAVDIRRSGCSLRKFTIELDPASIEFWDIAVYVKHEATSTHIDSIRVLERPNYTILRISYVEDTLAENCYFVVDDDETSSHGIEIIANDNYNTIVRNCSVTGFSMGILVQRHASALLEGNIVEGNNRGLHIGLQGDPEFDPAVDLGGGALGGTGGNIIRNSTECGLRNESTVSIYAIGNTWGNDPPVEGEDYCNLFGGQVIWE